MNFCGLPVEMHFSIFEYLSYSDLLLSISIINSKFNSMVNSYHKFFRMKELSNYKYYKNCMYRHTEDRELSLLFDALLHNKTIKILRIYFLEYVSSDTLKKLSNVLTNSMYIDKISLYFNHTEQITYLLTGLASNKSIESLTIHFSKHYYYGKIKNLEFVDTSILIDSLCKIVKVNTNLIYLNISYIYIGNERINKLIKSISLSNTIRSLSMQSTACIIDRQILDSLANTNLEVVNLKHNKISDLSYIQDWIQKNKIILKIY